MNSSPGPYPWLVTSQKASGGWGGQRVALGREPQLMGYLGCRKLRGDASLYPLLSFSLKG